MELNLKGRMYYQSKTAINVIEENCGRILRSNNKIDMKYKFSNLTKLNNSPYFRGVKLWNKLPK